MKQMEPIEQSNQYLGCLDLYEWPVKETTLIYFIYDKLNFGTPEIFNQNIHYFAVLQDSVACIMDRIDLAFSGNLQWCDVTAEPLRKAGFKTIWKNPKYKTEAERKCIKLQRSMYFAVFVICFWNKLKDKNPTKYCISQIQFIQAYPQFCNVNNEESVKLVAFRNVVAITKRLSGLFYCKEVVMDLIPRISEGHAYTTGGGAGIATKRRYEIFEFETARTKKPHALRSRHQHQVVVEEDDEGDTADHFNKKMIQEAINKEWSQSPSPSPGAGAGAGALLDMLLREVQKEAPVAVDIHGQDKIPGEVNIPGINVNVNVIDKKKDMISLVEVQTDGETASASSSNISDNVSSGNCDSDSSSSITNRRPSSLDVLTSAVDIEITKKIKREQIEIHTHPCPGTALGSGGESQVPMKNKTKRSYKKKMKTDHVIGANNNTNKYPTISSIPTPTPSTHSHSMPYGFHGPDTGPGTGPGSNMLFNPASLYGHMGSLYPYQQSISATLYNQNNPNGPGPAGPADISQYPESAQNIANNIQNMQMFYHIQQQAAAMAMQMYPHGRRSIGVGLTSTSPGAPYHNQCLSTAVNADIHGNGKIGSFLQHQNPLNSMKNMTQDSHNETSRSHMNTDNSINSMNTNTNSNTNKTIEVMEKQIGSAACSLSTVKDESPSTVTNI